MKYVDLKACDDEASGSVELFQLRERDRQRWLLLRLQRWPLLGCRKSLTRPSK